MQKSNWNKYKLESLCTNIFSGGTPKSTVSSYYGGDIPWLRTQEVNFQNIYDTDIKITENGLKNSSAKWVNKNTVIIAMYGNSAGRSAIAKIPLTTNQACCCLEIDSNKADYKFIYNFLKLNYQQIKDLANGGAQQNLNSLIIKNLEIDLPPIEEQKRIAGVLGAFDDKIELLQKQNTTLENMAKALFKSWFVDFDVVHAKQQGQPKAAIMQQYHLTEELYNLFPSSFEPSALGPIPTGWQVNPLENLARLIMGQSPAGTSYNEKGEGLPFYQGSTDFSFRFPKKRVYCTAPTRIAEKGDILISVRAPVGDLNIATEKTCIGRGLAALHPTNSMYSFLYYSLLNAKKRLSVFNTEGTVFGSINRKDLSSLLLLNPSKEMMQSFNTLVLPFDIKIESNHKQIQTLTEMRDALLPRLISGKIRV